MKRALLFAAIALTAISAPGQEPKERERAYSVPDVNGRALLLVRPEFPPDVSAKEDGNTLIVKVVVNENGDVVSAKCAPDCPRAAVAAAEAAASSSKFRPLYLNGRVVKYDGTLMYTIAVARVNWYRFAVALQSTYVFDNLSLGPVAAMLTGEFADERGRLEGLDHDTELSARWKVIEGVKESIRGKLRGGDAWWFELGFAVREATFPFQSDGKLDLGEVQAAVSKLARFVESAPPDVPPQTVENLRALSAYKIGPTTPPREVRQAVFKLASGIKP